MNTTTIVSDIEFQFYIWNILRGGKKGGIFAFDDEPKQKGQHSASIKKKGSIKPQIKKIKSLVIWPWL